METQSFIATLINNAALVENENNKNTWIKHFTIKPHELKKDAQSHTLDEWINKHKVKVGSVGGLTGLLGGPAGLLLEGADMGYLASIMGRLCFGIGHIKRKNVDYKSDMEGILAIWGGSAKGISTNELKNRAKKIYGEEIIHNNELFQKYLSQIKINNKLILNDEYSTINQNIRSIILASTKAGIKVGGKSALKSGIKIGTKMLAKKVGVKVSPKLLAKASAKLSAKVATKMSTKWIPIVGGITSATINIWVLNGLAESAKEYYNSNYILLSSDISKEAFDETINTIKDYMD